MTEHKFSVKTRQGSFQAASTLQFDREMRALPPATVEQLVLALKRLGFRMKARAGGLTTMCRYSDEVVVPDTATLGPALVAAILRAAGVDSVDFLRVTERRSPPSTRPRRAVA